MDEQSSDSQQPGIWESWTAASANPSAVPEAGETGQASTSGQGADSGRAGQFGAPDATGPLPTFTQPIGYQQAGYPQAGYQDAGYRQPGYAQGQPGYAQPGYAQAGYPQQGQPGHTAPGQPGYAGYGYPPSGGFGQPPGGYGGPGGYGQPPGGYGGPGGYGQPPRRPRRRALTTAITYLAVAAIAATAGGLVVAFAADGSSPPAASAGNNSGLGLPGGGIFPGTGGGNNGASGNNGGSGAGSGAVSGSTEQRLRAAVTPGLVVITSSLKYDGAGVAAAATGMIISHNGLVLTNNHVINGTTGLVARVVDTNKQYNATWLGYDKGSDVAVIKLEGASNLPTVPIGDSSTVKVGDGVVGMGNANGTGKISYVAGTITNLDQTITASDDGSGQAAERLTGMLQTNAQIIPGDSGGPLVSTDGKVIGMDTAASTSSTENSGQNVGFAIPINRAITLAREIITKQPGTGIKIGSSGFIGVLVPSDKGSQSNRTNPGAQLRQEEAQDQASGLNNPAPNSCVQSDQNAGLPTRIAPVSSGTLVLGSLCSTPADQAGIGAGDVITRVNGRAVSSPASLMHILGAYRGGTTVKVTWVTPGNQSVTRVVRLSEAPPQ